MESHIVIGLGSLAIVIGFIILIRRYSEPETNDNQASQPVEEKDRKAQMRK